MNILLLWLCTTLFSSAAIYGTDNRKEVTEFPWLNRVSQSVAAVVPNMFLKKNPDGTFLMEETETLGESTELCKDVKFLTQPSIGNCTAFLVDEQTVVTAGHCYLNVGTVTHDTGGWCEAFGFYFDYTWSAANPTDLSAIPADKIYHCKEIVRAENIDVASVPLLGAIGGNDFAVIKLDRKVTGRSPLRLAPRRPRNGEWVYTLGHPFGLPLKHSGYSKVTRDDLSLYFSVNLDSLGGNSGGPVFNIYNEVTGVLSSGHQIDDTRLPGKKCDTLNVCDSDGKNCLEDSTLQTTNQIFDIQLVRPWL